MSAVQPGSGPGIWGKEAALSMGTGISSIRRMSQDHHLSSFFIFNNVLLHPRSSCPPREVGLEFTGSLHRW